MPDRTKAILGEGESPVKALVESSQLLVKAGATFLAFPCNTAHYFLPEVEAVVSIPIINVIEETTAEVEQRAFQIGILATGGTVKRNLQTALKARGIGRRFPMRALAVMEAIYAVKASAILRRLHRFWSLRSFTW